MNENYKENYLEKGELIDDFKKQLKESPLTREEQDELLKTIRKFSSENISKIRELLIESNYNKLIVRIISSINDYNMSLYRTDDDFVRIITNMLALEYNEYSFMIAQSDAVARYRSVDEQIGLMDICFGYNDNSTYRTACNHKYLKEYSNEEQILKIRSDHGYKEFRLKNNQL